MSQRRHISILVPMAAMVAVVAVGVAMYVALEGRPKEGVPVAPAGRAETGSAHDANPASIRTVLISDTLVDFVSEPGGDVRVFLSEGEMPARGTSATVLTDENCEPDERGVSHCLNRLDLVGGQTLQVIHHHRMTDVPCLTPGEQVLVEPLV